MRHGPPYRLGLPLSSLVRPALSAERRLLDDVSQLVSNKLEPVRRLGRESGRPEDDIATDGIGMRVYRASRLGREAVGMDPHTAEVVPEPWFDEGSDMGIERLTG